jgi:hypothetical protein
MVSEKDRPILGYLLNIELDLHPKDKGDGYDLIFTFSPNSYFEGTVLTKQFFISQGILVNTKGTDIKWKDACDPTKKK